MTDKTDTGSSPPLTDAELDRFLDELKAPPPSDLLRARLHAAAQRKASVGRPLSPAAAMFSAPRAAFCGRLAAALVLAGLVGMAVWLPAAGPARKAGPVQMAAAAAAPSNAVADLSGTGDEAGSGPTLALVGGGDAAIGGVGLVQAGWSQADRGAGADGDEGLDEVPLY